MRKLLTGSGPNPITAVVQESPMANALNTLFKLLKSIQEFAKSSFLEDEEIKELEKLCKIYFNTFRVLIRCTLSLLELISGELSASFYDIESTLVGRPCSRVRKKMEFLRANI